MVNHLYFLIHIFNILYLFLLINILILPTTIPTPPHPTPHPPILPFLAYPQVHVNTPVLDTRTGNGLLDQPPPKFPAGTL
jgi:hypothetical protein